MEHKAEVSNKSRNEIVKGGNCCGVGYHEGGSAKLDFICGIWFKK